MTALLSDRLVASGPISLNGGRISLADLGGTQLADGVRFVLLENVSASSSTGTFANAPPGAVLEIGQTQYTIEYGFAADADGVANDVVLRAVPEPRAFLLLAAAAGWAFGCRRRGKK